MSDLRKIGDLLTLQGAGVLECNHVGGSAWLRACKAYRLVPPLEHLLWEREPMIGVLPLRRAGHYLERVPSSLLWARTHSGAAAAKLRQFRPLPDVVLREGGSVRYVAFWALQEPLSPDLTEQANRRLAKYLNAGQYADAAADFQFFLPGAVVRHGRGRPVPVELTRFEPALHTAREVVGRLKDPPTDEEKRELAVRAKERREKPSSKSA